MDCHPRACQIVRMLLSLLILLSAAGCATVGHLVENLTEPPMHRNSVVYAGTRYHLHEIPLYSTRNRRHWADNLAYSFRWWHYVDLPLCLCADTLLLAYTIPRDCYTWWQNLPAAEEKAFGALVVEWSYCKQSLNDLDYAKRRYAHEHGLAPSTPLPQDPDVYRAELRPPANKESFYLCLRGGVYRIGALGDEPSCSIHGSLSQVEETWDFLIKNNRLPETGSGEIETDSNPPLRGPDDDGERS